VIVWCLTNSDKFDWDQLSTQNYYELFYRHETEFCNAHNTVLTHSRTKQWHRYGLHLLLTLLNTGWESVCMRKFLQPANLVIQQILCWYLNSMLHCNVWHSAFSMLTFEFCLNAVKSMLKFIHLQCNHKIPFTLPSSFPNKTLPEGHECKLLAKPLELEFYLWARQLTIISVTTAFDRSNTGIVVSNPTRSMDVCECVYSVFCVVLCVGRDLATGWSPVQGALLTVYRIKKLKKRPRSTWAVEPYKERDISNQIASSGMIIDE
jgi:hypothetical protein